MGSRASQLRSRQQVQDVSASNGCPSSVDVVSGASAITSAKVAQLGGISSTTTTTNNNNNNNRRKIKKPPLAARIITFMTTGGPILLLGGLESWLERAGKSASERNCRNGRVSGSSLSPSSSASSS